MDRSLDCTGGDRCWSSGLSDLCGGSAEPAGAEGKDRRLAERTDDGRGSAGRRTLEHRTGWRAELHCRTLLGGDWTAGPCTGWRLERATGKDRCRRGPDLLDHGEDRIKGPLDRCCRKLDAGPWTAAVGGSPEGRGEEWRLERSLDRKRPALAGGGPPDREEARRITRAAGRWIRKPESSGPHWRGPAELRTPERWSRSVERGADSWSPLF